MNDPMVTLREWDWNAQQFVETEYPFSLLKPFLDYLHAGKRWRENPEMVYPKLLELERDLTEYRNEQALLKAEEAKATRCSALTNSGEQCKRDAVEDGICAVHRTMREREAVAV